MSLTLCGLVKDNKHVLLLNIDWKNKIKLNALLYRPLIEIVFVLCNGF